MPGRRAAAGPGRGIRPHRPVRESGRVRAPGPPQSAGISTKLVQLHRAAPSSAASAESEASDASDASEVSAGHDDSEPETGDGGEDAAAGEPPPPPPATSASRAGVECRERAESPPPRPTSPMSTPVSKTEPDSGLRELSRSYTPCCRAAAPGAGATADSFGGRPECQRGALAGGWLVRRAAETPWPDS